MSNDVQISVLIVSWNSCEYTLRSIASVLEQPTKHAVEVIVVDNASQDGSADAIAARFPGVRLIRSAENLGFGRANNLALESARGRDLLLLNSDAFLDPGSIDALAAHMRTEVYAACAVARLRYPDERPQPSCFRFPAPFPEALAALGIDRWLLPRYADGRYGMAAWRRTQPCKVDWAMGACMLVRRSALGEESLFDPRFFMYSEETDLCLRLRRRGFGTWFVPAATAVHVWGGSSTAVDHFALRRFYESRALFLEKHYGRASAAAFRIALRVGSVLRVGAATVLLTMKRDAALERTRARYAALLH
jgi:GT2 family glycosyltransferase